MNNTRKYPLLIILLVLAVYYNSFGNEFVWDDEFLIVNNPSIMFWKYAWIHFALDLYHTFSNYYRPIQMITYMIDFSLWHLDPFGYHLTNVFLHILVSLSILTLLNLITKNKEAAFIGTLLYAVHPAHAAVVTYIAGRADSLVTLFSLLSLICFHRHFKAQNKYAVLFLYLGSLILFLFALLSKEVAIIFPAIILCYRLFFISEKEVGQSRNVIRFHYISCFIVILGVYLILRMKALNFIEQGIFESKYPFHSRLLTSLKAIGIYFGIIFLPFNLYMERSIPYVSSFFEKGMLLSCLLLLFILWLVIRVRRRIKAAFFGFLFFIIFLLPVMNVYPLFDNMAEHWLYTPMIGISIILSSLWLRFWGVKKGLRPVLLFFIVFYLIFFSYKTVDRNFDWRNEYTIYTHTLNYSPKSIKVLNNLGNLYHKKGDFEKAVMFHKRAIEINPREYRTYFNLGRDYEALGMLDEALAQYEKSLYCNPGYAKAHFNVGNIHIKRGEVDKAIAAYCQALLYDDLNIGARINLGNIYFDKGLYKKAKDEYERVIKMSPYLPAAHDNLGNALGQLGCYKEAIEEYKKAIELAPENADYHFSLGTAYGKIGRYDEAIKELKKAHQLKPVNVEILINLGVTYFHNGDFSSAEKEWQKVLWIDPENKVALSYLEKIYILP